jgi:hypothetical protein
VPRGTSRGCWTPWQGGARVSAGSSLPQGQPDHAGGAEELGRRAGDVSVGRPRGASRSAASRRSRRRSAPDHVRLLTGRVLFTGDTELGEGSVFIGPGERSLAAYLDSLRRLLERPLETLCSGHGRSGGDRMLASRSCSPPARARGGAYSTRSRACASPSTRCSTRLGPRPRRAAGPAAVLTLAAHLDKLVVEGRLPDGSSARASRLGAHDQHEPA